MRRILLIIGLLALLATSVFTTLYLVNHPLRPAEDERRISIGVEEPAQIIDPQDLLAPPEQRGKAVAPDSLDAPAPRFARPAGYMMRVPDWQPSVDRVEAAQLVADNGPFIKPVWSPVGLDIAFTREDNSGLFLASSTPGVPVRLLAADAGVGRSFVWTNDGMSIQSVAADGTETEFLITGERFPDEYRLDPRVFVRDDRIFIRDEDGQEKQISGMEDRFTEPVLSPDELKVVYRGRETGLYIGLADGTRVIYVGPGRNATWLPDSRGIVYDQPVSDGLSIIDSDLWLATVDGRSRTNLTNTPGIVESWPSVAPDGQRIAFIAGGSLYVGKLVRTPAE